MTTRIIILFIIFTNIAFSQTTYTLTAPDSISLGERYKCNIKFDSIEYKDCLIEVYFLNSKLPKLSKHEFILEYFPILKENEYELKVNSSGCEKPLPISIKHKFYVDFKKAKGRPATKQENEMLKASKQVYTSNKYKTFEEYILVNVKANKIKCREKISFLYSIDKNNVTFIDEPTGKMSAEDKLILKKVVEACKDLSLPNSKPDPYRRTLMPLDLAKLD